MTLVDREPSTAEDSTSATEPAGAPASIAAAVADRSEADRANPRAVARLRRASRGGSIAVAIVGGLGVVGWITGLKVLTTLGPGVANMKFNTAVGLVLLGLSLRSVSRVERPRNDLTALALAAGYGAIGLLTLAEYATRGQLGLDNSFGFDDAGTNLGRMAMTTAACFVIMAIAFAALVRRRAHLGQFAALTVTVIGMFAIVGYAFGFNSLYRVGAYAPIALHTSIAFITAGLAALFSRPDDGFVALTTGNSAGGVTIRRMLIPALTGPLIVGAFLDRAARSAGLPASGLAGFTIAMILLSGTLVCVIGASLRHVDLRRAGAEDAFGVVQEALADREHALRLLSETERQTRRIVDTARDAFISIDERGVIANWNRAAEETFGWGADEAIGRSLGDLTIRADDRAAYQAEFADLVSGASTTLLDETIERGMVRKDGSELTVELTVWRTDNSGDVTFNAFARDISARTAAEESISRLAAVVEQSSDAIITIDTAGIVLDWNRGAENIYGYRAADMIGNHAASVLSPGLELPDREVVQLHWEQGTSTTGRELTLVHADGRAITVLVTSSPILDAQGKFVAVSNISHDISDQKAAELALHESEARTKTSLDFMLDGFSILRSVRIDGAIVDFEWIYMNPAGAALYGRTVDEMVGTTLQSFAPGLWASGGFAELCHVVTSGEVRSRQQSTYVDDAIEGVFDSVAWKLDDGFAFTWRDVTDRERAVVALKSSEEQFRSTIENLHEALSVLTAIRDEAGCIVDFRWVVRNAAAVEMTRFAAVDLEGKTLMQLLPESEFSRMLDIYRDVVETGRPYTERSVWQDDELADGSLIRRAFDVRATKLNDGFVILTREVTQQREQEDELERQRLGLERSNTEMRLLNALADMLQSCATSEEAYAVATQSCADLFADFSGSISVMPSLEDAVDMKASWGDSFGPDSFAPDDCWALRRGRPYLSSEAGARCGHLSGYPQRTCLCVPMVGPSNPLGVVQLMATGHESTGQDDGELETGPALRLAVTVAGQLSMAFANLRLRESLREMSIRDPLTGLFNRRYMEETLARELSLAARTKTNVGMIVLDVDHFKAFNDTHGHDAGDAVLAAVGHALMRHSRMSDVACRYGGEEFVVILPNCPVGDTEQRANELRRHISELRVPYHGRELSGPTISCGIAAYPQHAGSAEALIHVADTALYAAKAAGRDQVVVAPPVL